MHHVNRQVLLNMESCCHLKYFLNNSTNNAGETKCQIFIILYYHTSSKGNLKLHNIILHLVWPPGKIMTLISFNCKLMGPSNVNFLFALSIISTLVLGSESHVHCRTPTNQQLIGWPSFEKINGPIRYFHIIMWLDLQKKDHILHFGLLQRRVFTHRYA